MTGAVASEVRSTATLVDQLDWQVRLLVQPVNPEPPQIELVDATSNARAPGENVLTLHDGKLTSRRIEFLRPNKYPRFVLAHELTHWHADGAWDKLPLVLEESLCEWVGCALDLDAAAMRDRDTLPANVVLKPDVIRWAFELTPADVARLSPTDRNRWYSVAFRLSKCFDALALRALAERAQHEGRATVDPQWVLDELTATGLQR